jgi:ribonuclease HI
MDISLYTDGSCRVNPGAGAWGFIVIDGAGVEYDGTGYNSDTTNNRMELQAAIQGIEKIISEGLSGQITVYSDSAYLVDCMSKRWYVKWIKHNWKLNHKKDVKNVDLWQQLIKLTKYMNIKWQWIRGHNGNKYNEMCDLMCNITMSANSESENAFGRNSDFR